MKKIVITFVTIITLLIGTNAYAWHRRSFCGWYNRNCGGRAKDNYRSNCYTYRSNCTTSHCSPYSPIAQNRTFRYNSNRNTRSSKRIRGCCQSY